MAIPNFNVPASSIADSVGSNTWNNIAGLALEVHNTLPILATVLGLFMVIGAFRKLAKNTSQMQANNDGENIIFKIIAGTALCSLGLVMFASSNTLFGVSDTSGMSSFIYAQTNQGSTPVLGMKSAIFALASLFGWFGLLKALLLMGQFGENSQEKPVPRFWGYFIGGIAMANLPVTIGAVSSLFI